MAALRWIAAANLAAVLTMGSTARAEPGFSSGEIYAVPADGAPAMGDATAPITIVEYSDFACRYCRRGNDTVTMLMNLFPGLIRLVYRHHLLDWDDGTIAAEAALAAEAQGAFWPMHDRLFAGVKADPSIVELYTRELGLDPVALRVGVESGAFRRQLTRYRKGGDELGVRAVPMFFVNGRPIAGARGLGVFLAVMRREMTRAMAVMDSGATADEIYAASTRGGRTRAHELGDDDGDWAPVRLDRARTYELSDTPPEFRLGPDDAPITIVEFSDFECGFCAKAAPVLAELVTRHAGKVQVQYRFSLLSPDMTSQHIAEAAVAAARQGKFWPFHDRIFQARSLGRRLGRVDLERFAGELGLDMVAFRLALDQRSHAEVIAADTAQASALGVSGTPTFFVNGQPLVGFRPDELRGMIDARLAKSPGKQRKRPAR